MSSRRLMTFIIGLIIGLLSNHLFHMALHSIDFGHLRLAKFGLTDANLTVSANQTDLAKQLYDRVRVLCLIITRPNNYGSRAVAINNTWARRCNRYAFFGSKKTKLQLPLVVLNMKEGRSNLWKKTWMSFEYAGKHFNFDNFDFILKSDDDTYVIMENLRYLLLGINPNEKVLLGRIFQPDRSWPEIYTSGGAAYVLSRRAAKDFVRGALTKQDPCNLKSHQPEDYKMGMCLQKLGVSIVDSRDSLGLERFHPVSPEFIFGFMRNPKWLFEYNYFKFNSCMSGCASHSSVSIHYIEPYDMHLLEFLLYEVRPIGVDPVARDSQLALKSLTDLNFKFSKLKKLN